MDTKSHDKFIIHNYTTELSELTIMNMITKVIEGGKISKSSHGPHYCAITSFTIMRTRFIESCKRRNNTYTFEVYKD